MSAPHREIILGTMAAHSSFKHKPAALLRFQVIKHESPDEPDRSSILQILKKCQERKFSTGVERESERRTAQRTGTVFLQCTSFADSGF